MTTDRERLAEIEAREAKATPLPWRLVPRQEWWATHPYYHETFCTIEGSVDRPHLDATQWEIAAFNAGGMSKPPDEVDMAVAEVAANNAMFLYHAREDIPWLRTRLALALAVVEAVRNALPPEAEPFEDGEATCADCGTDVHVRDGQDFDPGDLCDECAQKFVGKVRATLAAFDRGRE